MEQSVLTYLLCKGMKDKETRDKSISSEDFYFQSAGHGRSPDEMARRYGLRMEYSNNEHRLRRGASIEKQHKRSEIQEGWGS